MNYRNTPTDHKKPGSPASTQIGMRMPMWLIGELDRRCIEADLTRTQIVRAALKAYLKLASPEETALAQIDGRSK